MNKIITGVLFTVFAPLALAAEDTDKSEKQSEAVVAQDCTIKDTASLYYTVRLDSADDTGKVYEEKVNHLAKVAKDNDIEGFHILSQDVSVGQPCCGSNGVDLSISFSFEYSPSYKALTTLAKESGAQSISSSRYIPSGCK
ncbi:MAG: hypothetical protein KBT75_01190 [Oleispira antarctica]|nr:hypothetical protein [Oleispira antarctica]MBQ0790950.1 hypothetical protein [Oleispira antarctica]